jgi:hypothetical protein
MKNGAGLQRVKLPPQTGSLHPEAIEVGCFYVTKSTVSRDFPAGSRAAPVLLPGGFESVYINDGITLAAVSRHQFSC